MPKINFVYKRQAEIVIAIPPCMDIS